MTDINLTSTTVSGFLETDFDQIKDVLQDGGVNAVQFTCSGDLTVETGNMGVGSTSTGAKLFVDQNDNSIGLEIDSEATTSTNYALKVVADQGARPAYIATGTTDYYEKKQANSGDGAHYFFRDLAAANTAGPVLIVRQNNAGDDQPAMKSLNEGTGQGLFIDNNGDSIGLEIDSEATTNTSYGLKVNTSQGANPAIFESGAEQKVEMTNANNVLYVYRNISSATTTNPVVRFRNDNAGDDQPLLQLTNDAVSNALEITSSSEVKAPLKLPSYTSDPTGAHVVGEIAVVSGVLKICTAAGTPGTWTVVGTQT